MGSSACAQVKSCGQGQGQQRRGTRERQVGSTLAAEAQAISATCAVSRTPARAIASRGEGRGARPGATDEPLVGVGQGVCALPSRKEGTCAMRGERAWGDGSASGTHEDGPTQGWGGQGTRGAHVEHSLHVCDLGRVPIVGGKERKKAGAAGAGRRPERSWEGLRRIRRTSVSYTHLTLPTTAYV